MKRGQNYLFEHDSHAQQINLTPFLFPFLFTESCNLDRVTANHIRSVLKMTNGRVEGKKGAAQLLGINPGTLRNRMRKMDISFGRNYFE
jgi:transcriptional regulator with GAF, ATPase, and Fis domain